jgi:anti-sigma B factor antagonist
MDGIPSFGWLWKVACNQQIVLNWTTVIQDRDGKLLRRLELERVLTTSEGGLEITVLQTDDGVLIRLSGRIDVNSSPDLRDRLLAILSDEPSPRSITVDLAGVSYIETSGIATLIEALKIARHHQTTLCLQGLGGSVLRLFEVTGMLALFDPGGRGEKVS